MIYILPKFKVAVMNNAGYTYKQLNVEWICFIKKIYILVITDQVRAKFKLKAYFLREHKKIQAAPSGSAGKTLKMGILRLPCIPGSKWGVCNRGKLVGTHQVIFSVLQNYLG